LKYIIFSFYNLSLHKNNITGRSAVLYEKRTTVSAVDMLITDKKIKLDLFYNIGEK